MKRKIRFILIAVLFTCLAASPFFIKVKVECRSQSGQCPVDISSALRSLKNKNLFQARKVSRNILKKSFLISDFSMQFKLPNVLLINTIVKKPAYSVFDRSSGKYFLLDEKGMVLAVAEKSNLPTLIKEVYATELGTTTSEPDLFALKIIRGVMQMYQISVGTIQNDSLVVDLPSGIRVIFPLGDSEVDVLLGSLRLIYNRITADYPGVYSQIDMRYKNPVLR